ncbi:hypothetical protein GCM10010253_26820 [Streptomyces badius]|uniref:Uncharacterized protein n=1 Tax=Streptomyces badius TaxID=1941 RepID=A0ABQ2T3E2_STRBA|nr:hypothetical protein GCM10010253_26820 [Streptomyces badius]
MWLNPREASPSERHSPSEGPPTSVAGGEVLQLDAGAARVCGPGPEGAYDPGVGHVVRSGEGKGSVVTHPGAVPARSRSADCAAQRPLMAAEMNLRPLSAVEGCMHVR